MLGTAPDCRGRYYAATLDLGLSLSLEIEKQQEDTSPVARRWTQVSVLDVVKPSHSSDSSPTSDMSLEMLDAIDISPSTVTSDSSLSLQMTFIESSNTSPTTIATESSFPSSSTSPTSEGPELLCDLCGKSFTGSSSATNLERHKRTAKIHQTAKYPCLDPACRRRYSRSDNRNVHFYKAHPPTSAPQLRLPATTKRQRDEGDDESQIPGSLTVYGLPNLLDNETAVE